MGFPEPTAYEMEMAKARQASRDGFWNSTFPSVCAMTLFAAVILGIAYLLWDVSRFKAEQRVKEVEAAAAAGMVEQPARNPGHAGLRNHWVHADQYEAKILELEN